MTDDQLLEQFFQQARQTEVPDNGFSDRVMQQITLHEAQHATSHAQRLSRLWTAFCIVVAAVLFVLLHGWEPIAYALMMLVNTPPTQHQLLMLVASVGVLGLLAIWEIIGRERYSAL